MTWANIDAGDQRREGSGGKRKEDWQGEEADKTLGRLGAPVL